MNPRLQRRVQCYGWDKAAAHDDRTWQRQLETVQTTLLTMANLAPGGSVVDIACGTGLVTLAAAHTVAPGGKVLGTDISDDMLAIARATAGQQGIANCTFKRMDAEDLGFESGTFDVALCALGLMYAPDPEGAVAERHRVLKPSGRAVSAV